MGYYVEVPRNHGKAEQIRDIHGGVIVDHFDAVKAMLDPAKGVIVVVDNGPFEAAGFAFSEDEFNAFTDLRDPRPKQFVVLPRALAEKLSHYVD